MSQRGVPAADFSAAGLSPSPSAPASFQRSPRNLSALYALALYLSLSIIFFGRGLFGHLSDLYFGVGVDPALMMWSLVWWPHALAHGLNPLLTKVIWSPSGANLAWSTTIPLASLLFCPLTLTAGPIATYNILCLIAFPVNALCAFLLCRYLTGDCFASLLGGYIFGFSPFMLGQLTSGHLHLILAFCVPLSIYLCLLHTEGRITQRNLVLILASVLIAQFLLSLEIFATMTVLGAFALLLSWSYRSSRQHAIVPGLLAPIACAYGLAIVVLSPYLYYFFAHSVVIGSDYTASFFSADPLNLLVPTLANELGLPALFSSVSTRFVGGWTSEAGAYISAPLLLIGALYTYHHWQEHTGKLLICCLAATVLLSLGPTLHTGLPVFPQIALPWWILGNLPLLKNAYAARLSLYTFLVLAIIATSYLALDLSTRSTKIILAVGVLIFNLPNASSAFWLKPLDTPEFFSSNQYRRYIEKRENVLIFPYSYTGNSMLWQAQTNIYFDMAGGTTQPAPDDFRRWPIFASLMKRAYVPKSAEQLEAFAAADHIDSVVVTDGMLPTWRSLLSTLDANPVKAGGISIYRLPSARTFDSDATWRRLRSQFDTLRLRSLVMGAKKYLSRGGDLNSLDVRSVEESASIPVDELVGPSTFYAPGVQDFSNQNRDPHFADGVWVGRTRDGMVALGEEIWCASAAPLIENLRAVASRIYYPYPYELGKAPRGHGSENGWLLLTFTRAQLSQAAALLSANSPPANTTSTIAASGCRATR